MINQGKVENGIYIKKFDFSRAVLWKDKQISLNPDILDKLVSGKKVTAIWFEDDKKNERWIIALPDFIHNSAIKKVGQESQYYCPISLFDREVIRKNDIKPVSTEIRPKQEKMF